MATWLLCDPFTPFKIEKQQIIIGRGDECDITLPHKIISRNHAVIKNLGNDRFVICDLASSNGTFVNNRQVTRHIIQPGDRIKIGQYQLHLSDKPTDFSSKTDFFTASKKFSVVGQLDSTSLVEVLQSIEFHKKTGLLVIKHEILGDGSLIFGNGQPITASFGGESGEHAILEMLKLKTGYFMTTNQVEPAEVEINASFTTILLEYLRRMDERNERNPESTDLDIVCPPRRAPSAPTRFVKRVNPRKNTR
jgi:hypothetical protein